MTKQKKPHGNLGRKNPHGNVAYQDLTREEQLAYHREKNRAYYLQRVGALKRISPLENTPEREAQRCRDKSNRRATRAKQARIIDEFTAFVTSEAHELRKLRNNSTDIEWHVDHIIPLKGKQICGLHIWSNLAVIPKTQNLSKGNKLALHDQWKEGLQEGTQVGTHQKEEQSEG